MQKAEVSGKHNGSRLRFQTYGDRDTIRRLWLLYQDILHTYDEYDPTLDDSGYPRSVVVNDTCHAIDLEPSDIREVQSTFGCDAHVLVLVYNTNSRASLRTIGSIYDQFPKPMGGRIQLSNTNTTVGAERYPVVLIGCKYPVHAVREVEEHDMQAFLESRPCVFASECELDENTKCNVDGVVRVVVETYHELTMLESASWCRGLANENVFKTPFREDLLVFEKWFESAVGFVEAEKEYLCISRLRRWSWLHGLILLVFLLS